jgi:hypothetical protein
MGTEVHLGVAEEASDAGRLEELSLRLRQEILALDVESVRPYTAGDAPEGTRGTGAAVAGALVVSLQPTLQTVRALVGLVRDWLLRGNPQRTVRIELDGDVLELTGATADLQQRLVDEWIHRHATG